MKTVYWTFKLLPFNDLSMLRINGPAFSTQSLGACCFAAALPNIFSNIGVLMTPGSKGTQVRGAGISAAMAWENPSTANLLAQYAETLGDTLLPQAAEILTMTPFFALTMWGRKWRTEFATPLILMSRAESKSSLGTFQNFSDLLAIEALFMRRSGTPKSATIVSAHSCISALLATLTTWNWSCPVACSKFKSSILDAVLPQPSTTCDDLAKNCVIAAPRPDVTPVIAMILPAWAIFEAGMGLNKCKLANSVSECCVM